MRFIFIIFYCFIAYSGSVQQNSFTNLIEKNGKIGIGTKNPDALLTVKGIIHAQEIQVDLKGAIAPDYVFEEYFLGTSTSNPNYQRLSLKELEVFLYNNHHLPGISPANKLEDEGMDIVKQNLLLLEKIEELTLYIIEQQKDLDLLKQKVEILEN